MNVMEFDLKPVSADHKQAKIVTIYGNKGEGKTALALGLCKALGNTMAALSYDTKTVSIWQNMYGSDPSLAIYDAIRYYDPSKTMMRDTAVVTLNYIEALLKSMTGNPPDWILHDGLEILSVIAEMKMRSDNNLKATEGFANKNLWKERRMALRHIHKVSRDIAKVGVIYTTYIEKDETIRDGDVIDKRDVPKWVDAVLYETDYVLKAFAKVEKTSIKHFVQVTSSKNDKFLKTGTLFDVSDEDYKKILQPSYSIAPKADGSIDMGKVKTRE